MRFAILGIWHETNTFSSVPTDFDAFVRSGIWRDREITAQFAGSRTTIGGFLEASENLGFEAVPLVYAQAGPSGVITGEAFDRITGEMARLLMARGPWDAVLLANHGAAVSAAYPDADGEVAARVRNVVGRQVPIGMALDMHANLSHGLILNSTVTVLYRTNPHLDAHLVAKECAEIVFRTAQGQVRPVQWLEAPPMVVNVTRMSTDEEPMKSIIGDCEEIRRTASLLSASAAAGFPYADVEHMGMSFLAISDGDETTACRASAWMAERAWTRRGDMLAQLPDVAEAIRLAAKAPKGPVLLLDVGDNVLGGSPGDSTIILAEAKRQGVRRLLRALTDPEAVGACVEAGVGKTTTLIVGGKTDRMHGEPVEVSGRIRMISDGKYEDDSRNHVGARAFDAGTTVVLETTDDHTLVLTSRPHPNISREQMYSLGVFPERYQVVVLNGVVSPRPAYVPIASQAIPVNTPGVTAADLSFFTYHRRRVPLFPFEKDTAYSV